VAPAAEAKGDAGGWRSREMRTPKAAAPKHVRTDFD